MVSPEVVPFAKTGGLADVVGALPHELEKLDAEVKIIMPKYKQINEDALNLQKTGHSITIPMGPSSESGTVWKSNTGKNIENLHKQAYLVRISCINKPI